MIFMTCFIEISEQIILQKAKQIVVDVNKQKFYNQLVINIFM